MMHKTLTELANYHGTDKGTIGPSTEWGAQNYTDIYQSYLESYRAKPVSILEIGLGVLGDRWEARIVHGRNEGGASLKMWYDYFPKGRILGVDVNACPHLDNDRIGTFVADQGKVAELQSVIDAAEGTEFDVIIDDGSHRPDHQQISLGFLFKFLKSGGLYFIEDLMPNGLGDNASGRNACDSVLNTYSVLKKFREGGTFAEPHALIDADYLTQHIEYLNFHAPRYGIIKDGNGNQKIVHKTDTEKLAAIKKR